MARGTDVDKIIFLLYPKLLSSLGGPSLGGPSSGCLSYELVGGFPFGEERSASLLCLIVDPPPVQPRLPSFLSVSFFPLSPFNPVWYPLPCPCMLCKFSRTALILRLAANTVGVGGNGLVAWLARPYVRNRVFLATQQLSKSSCILFFLALGSVIKWVVLIQFESPRSWFARVELVAPLLSLSQK